jgi:hypothetical protein
MEKVPPIIGLAEIPSKKNEMDHWSVHHLAKYRDDTGDLKKEAIKEAKFRIGQQAFKRRMKRNLDKTEYLRQMKILNMLSPSDEEKRADEDLNWADNMYKEFGEARRKTHTAQ